MIYEYAVEKRNMFRELAEKEEQKTEVTGYNMIAQGALIARWRTAARIMERYALENAQLTLEV